MIADWFDQRLRRERVTPQGAIREQLRVLEQAPDNISAIRFLTLAYLDADEVDKATALLEEKRRAFGENFVWRSVWALLLAVRGKRTEAVEAMDGETLRFARIAFVATQDVADVEWSIVQPAGYATEISTTLGTRPGKHWATTQSLSGTAD